METSDRDFNSDLLSKVFSGEASPEELAEFNAWIDKSDENRTFYQEMKNIWDASDRNLKPEDIDTGKALKNVLDTIARSERKQYRLITAAFLRRAAAVIFIPLLIGSYFAGKSSVNRSAGNSVMKEITAAPGTRINVTLADGSLVWLNSGSSLQYPEEFGKERRVMLRGEGYFEVVSDKSNPFVVATDNFDVTATGTKFNVRSDDNNPVFEVTLLEGNVDVLKNEGEGRNTLLKTLRPDEHLYYDLEKDSLALNDQEPYRYISWKDGKLIFRNDRMIDVAKELSQYYNVDVELGDEELTSYRYRATFDNETLDEILTMLKLSSPIDYYEVERSVLPDGTFTRRKVVIFTKK